MLDSARVVLADPHPYKAIGAVYAPGVSPYMLREGAARRLYEAQEELQKEHPGFCFLIWDALRPLNVQQQMVDLTLADFARREGKRADTLSPEYRERLMTETLKFWSVPTDDPKRPPLHSTGGAVDLTILDTNGAELDMGTIFDHCGDEAATDYFEVRDPAIHANRMLLKRVMHNAGFLNYANEWWHFGYGDQHSAMVQNQTLQNQQACAFYGRADLVAKDLELGF